MGTSIGTCAPLKCLRPLLRPRTRPNTQAASSAYLRFYSAAQAQIEPRIGTSTSVTERNTSDLYPRIKPEEVATTCKDFCKRYGNLRREETGIDEVVIRGRIWSFRTAGSKLAFVDLFQDNYKVQYVLNYDKIADAVRNPATFDDCFGSLRRGNILSVKGVPHRTSRNQLSVLATELPQLLSLCSQPLPEDLKDRETRMRNRHVDLLLNPRLSDTIRLKARITQFLREYLLDHGHVEVQTPILSDTVGGAIARPFTTTATETRDRKISLRIAPELWLKRLILGGFERVFEIGPSFRNEGIDLNHNPEFTTCEFYRTYTGLEELMSMTETMLARLSRVVSTTIQYECRNIMPQQIDFSPPYSSLDFIPAIETAIGRSLPNLTSQEAKSELLALFDAQGITRPSSPTVPRLLDKLSSTYLEPQCERPTWIINHPECLSPLSKSFNHPNNQQRVAARAELFIKKQELVNTYEEENSPTVQRGKFVEQLSYRADDLETVVNESYLQALEWGLPPTGGWGCGIERLCMLFAGTNRIADVLSFGTLRNVVARPQSSRNA
ncbi:hypothetical protein N7G274_008024 [Stereocaulon virgatum]|uniref:Lysyl-tRNA synthetase n=1 Tax=Stereocaulon virgatum TaxID=373712 RepID=A0ABR4A249_9LECA